MLNYTGKARKLVIIRWYKVNDQVGVVVRMPSIERRLLKYLRCKSSKGIKIEGNTHQAKPGAWRYLGMLQNRVWQGL